MTTAFLARCDGYVLTDADADELIRAARAVTAGAAIFSPAVALRMLSPFNGPRPLAPAVVPTRIEREREILDLLAQGLFNPRSAETLHVSVKTVANDVSSIFSTLQVADRAEAIVQARETRSGRGQRAPWPRRPHPARCHLATEAQNSWDTSPDSTSELWRPDANLDAVSSQQPDARLHRRPGWESMQQLRAIVSNTTRRPPHPCVLGDASAVLVPAVVCGSDAASRPSAHQIPVGQSDP